MNRRDAEAQRLIQVIVGAALAANNYMSLQEIRG